MSKNVNKLAYFIQGGIDVKDIFTKAMAYVIYCYSKKEILINKFSRIQALYAKEYKINLPEAIIREELAKNFLINNNKYEIKPYLGFTLDQVSDEFLKSGKALNEKLNKAKKLFYDYYNNFLNSNINKSNKHFCDDLFVTLFVDNSSSNSGKSDNEEYSLTFSSNYILKNSFLKYLLRDDNEIYELLQDIEIVNAISFNITPNFRKFDYKKIRLFLDTPILLKLLGYDGREYRTFLKKIFSIMGCSLYVFEHTVEETWGILYAWKNAFNQNNFAAKGLDLYLIARKQFGKDAERIIPLDRDKLEINIAENDIEIIEKLNLTSKNNVYDYNKLVTEFGKKYKNTYSSFPDRINKDIDSIFGIQALRIENNIINPQSFEAAIFYFLTDNKEYAKISEKNYIDSNNKYLCEIQYLDNIIYNIWTDSGKAILPAELFRLRCLTNNGISDDFRNEFTKLVNRLEKLDQKYEITDKLMNNPELIQKAHDVYVSNNKSIVHLTSFLKEECLSADVIGTDDNVEELKHEIEELKHEITELKSRQLVDSINNQKVSWFMKVFNIVKNFFCVKN